MSTVGPPNPARLVPDMFESDLGISQSEFSVEHAATCAYCNTHLYINIYST